MSAPDMRRGKDQMTPEEAREALVAFAMQHVPEPEEFVDAILADRDLVLSALGLREETWDESAMAYAIHVEDTGGDVDEKSGRWVFPSPTSTGDEQ